VLENVELQRSELCKPVDERFVRRNASVKGAYTTGDYVRLMLNQIFGPDNWSHTVLSGPELVRLNAGGAYIKTLVRLTVRFANGQQVVHEDVGVTVLTAGRSVALDEVAPERFETALKAAVTDGLKACAEHLGACFRPMGDADLERSLRGARPDSQAARRHPPVEVIGMVAEERSLPPARAATKS
jgi:Rad52/22 family double-strand break repair protein